MCMAQQCQARGNYTSGFGETMSVRTADLTKKLGKLTIHCCTKYNIFDNISRLFSPVKSWASVRVMPMMLHMSPSAPGQRQTRSDPVPSVTLPPLSVTPCPVSVLVPFTAPAPDSRRMRKSDPGARAPRVSRPGAMRGSHHSGDFVSVSLVKYVIKLKRKCISYT